MNKERYNQIIDEVYENYADSHWIPSLDANEYGDPITDWLNEYGDPEIYKKVERKLELIDKEWFIHEIKTNPEFSEKWGLIIKETYKLIPHTEVSSDLIFTQPVREYKKLIVVYKDEIIEVYE